MRKLVVYFVLTLFILTGCVKSEQTEKRPIYVEGGFFIIGSDMKPVTIEQIKTIPKTKIVDWYFDPLCPSCVNLEMKMRDVNKDITQQMYIKYNPMTFMDEASIDNYSKRSSGYILAVAEYSPEIAYSFLINVMNKDFYPFDERFTPDSMYKELYLSLGGTEETWKVISSKHEDFINEANKHSEEVFNDSYIINRTPEGKLYVPLIIVGESSYTLSFKGKRNAPQFFVEEVNKNLENKVKIPEDHLVIGLQDTYKENQKVDFYIEGMKDDESVIWYLEGPTNCSFSNKSEMEIIMLSDYNECTLVVEIKNKDGTITQTMKHPIKIQK